MFKLVKIAPFQRQSLRLLAVSKQCNSSSQATLTVGQFAAKITNHIDQILGHELCKPCQCNARRCLHVGQAMQKKPTSDSPYQDDDFHYRSPLPLANADRNEETLLHMNLSKQMSKLNSHNTATDEFRKNMTKDLMTVGGDDDSADGIMKGNKSTSPNPAIMQVLNANLSSKIGVNWEDRIRRIRNKRKMSSFPDYVTMDQPEPAEKHAGVLLRKAAQSSNQIINLHRRDDTDEKIQQYMENFSIKHNVKFIEDEE